MNKVYKKTIFSLACLCLFASTQIIGQNLLVNPSFESGILAPWIAGNDNIVNIIEDAQEGTYAAQGNIEQIVSLEAGVKYTWTTQVKCLGGCDQNMWIGIKDLVADALVTNYLFSSFNEYGEATIEFEAASSGDHRFWVWGVADTDYISDSHVLLKEGTTVNVTSIDEVSADDNNIQISSTQGGVNVNIDASINEADITITDLSGRSIYTNSIASGNTLINAHEFSATGIYLVAIKTEETLKVEKVYITK